MAFFPNMTPFGTPGCPNCTGAGAFLGGGPSFNPMAAARLGGPMGPDPYMGVGMNPMAGMMMQDQMFMQQFMGMLMGMLMTLMLGPNAAQSLAGMGGGMGGMDAGGGLGGGGGGIGGGGDAGGISQSTSSAPPGSGPIGSGAQGAMQWALSQEGISESRNPDVVRGYSKGRWQAWCADFVSTAFAKSGGSPWGHQSSVQGILDWGRRNPGHFISARDAQSNPSRIKPGDVVIWKQNGRSHTGIVTQVHGDGTFSTIEGNTSNKVAQRHGNRLNSSQLTGFVRAHGTF